MKILIFHATAGAGHKKIAEVIAKKFLARGLKPDEVEVIDALEMTPGWFRKSYPAIYFHSVKSQPKMWGWSYEKLDIPWVYNLVKGFRACGNRFVGGNIIKKVREARPDFVICTHFFTAQLLAEEKRRGSISFKQITVLTDFYPHSFWVNPGTDYYWIMGDEGFRDLVKRGVSKDQIFPKGIPVADEFKPLGRKNDVLKKWEFTEDRLTLLLTSGSFGLGKQEEILKALAPLKEKVQCFVVCGENKHLQKSLEAQSFPFPVKIFGFIHFMAELMEASDLIIAKSGGSTTTESLTKGVPLVVFQPIPGQETRNAALLKQRNAAFFMEEPAQMTLIVKAVLENPDLIKDKIREIKLMAQPNAADDLVSFVLKELTPIHP